jgi:PAS domain S-box-containing protein
MFLKFYRISVFLILSFTITVVLNAQINISLYEKQIKETNGSEKASLLNDLIKFYQNESLAKSLFYSRQAILLIDSIENKDLAGELLYNIANTNRLIGNTKEAKKIYETAYWYLSNNEIRKAEIIDNIGIIYRYMGLYDLSLRYHIEAFQRFSNINHKDGIISSLNNTGVVYKNLGQKETARKLYLYALKLNEPEISKTEKAISLTNIGNLDWADGKYTTALQNYYTALDISLSINDNNKICGLQNNIGNVLRDSGNYSGALSKYKEALQKNNMLGDNNLKAVILKNIGLSFYKKANNDSALFYLNRSLELASKGNLTRFEKDLYHNISNCYQAAKKYDKALAFFKLYTEYKDSLFNEETYKALVSVNEQFQVQQDKNKLYKADLKKQQQTIYIFVLITTVGLLLLLLIFNQYRQKRKHAHRLAAEIQDRIKAEKKIQQQNIEIQSQYEELVSSNEEMLKINSTIEENNIMISENEERFRLLFENSSDGLFLMTETISDCNKQACQLFDFPKEELIGISPADLSPANQPSGRSSEVMATEYINGAMAGKMQHFNWKHKRKDGFLFDCEITLIPIALKNNQFIYAKIVDISERVKTELKLKESEEKYSSLVNQVPIGIYRTNTEGNILYGNPALVRMLGYETIDELINVNINSFYVNLEDRNKQLANWKKLQSNIILSDEFKIKRKDGNIISVRFTDYAVQKESGEIDYFSGILEDITEQNTTEEKLKRLITNFPGVVYRSLMNKGSIMLFMSDETKNLTGFEAKEFVNKNMAYSDIIHPADRRSVIDTINKAVKNKLRYDLNYRIITKDGQIKWVYEQGLAVSAANSNISELEGFIIDITDRKQAEEILKESEEKYRSLVENIAEVLFTLNTGGYFTYFSPKISSITGFNADELIGRHFGEFIYKDDLDFLIKSFEKTLSGIFEPAEFRVVDKHGGLKYVRTSSSLIMKNGDVYGISGVMSDISSQKHAEKIRTLLFNISQAANYSQSIEEFYEILYSNLNEVIKTDNFYISLHNKSDDTISFPFFKDIKDQAPPTRKFGNGLTEYVIRTKEPLLKDETGLIEMFNRGDCAQILSVAKSWLGVPLKTQDEIIGVMTIQSYSDDIKFDEIEKDILIYCAEQIALVLKQKHNEELKRSIQLAEKTAQIKQQFLANMSHEMRTPMNGILGMVDFLLQTKLNEKQLDYAKTIKNSSETLLNLINDILDLSKIEAGTMKIIPNEFNIHSVLKEVVSLFKASLDQKGLAVKLKYSNDLPEYLVADKNRLNQIINNLISNAIKFSDSGNISITVSKISDFVETESTSSTDKKIKVKVEVQDTGIGIALEDQAELFTSFSQIDSTYTRNYEGTGLGLAISKRLVEMMGGEIGVKSEFGHGSTFWFSFIATPLSESTLSQTIKTKADFSKLNFGLDVLLVEDKFINQKVVTLMLKNSGCRTIIANNGLEALEMFEKNKIDLVLMDIQMPLMDGVTAVKELQKKYDKLPPIIGLSANAMEGDAEKYIAEGMDDYLSKPVSAEQLYEKISKWTSKK